MECSWTLMLYSMARTGTEFKCLMVAGFCLEASALVLHCCTSSCCFEKCEAATKLKAPCRFREQVRATIQLNQADAFGPRRSKRREKRNIAPAFTLRTELCLPKRIHMDWTLTQPYFTTKFAQFLCKLGPPVERLE